MIRLRSGRRRDALRGCRAPCRRRSRDDREDHHRARRPDELELRVAADLRPLDLARPAAAAVADDEEDQRALDEQEDRAGDAEDQPVDVADAARRPARPVRRARGRRCPRRPAAAIASASSAIRRRGREASGARAVAFYEACPNGRACNFPPGSASASRSSSTASSQQPGTGLPARGRRARLRPAAGAGGQLGFWRWLSLFLGVAGTYRQNDSVDVVYELAGRALVATGLPLAHRRLTGRKLDGLAVDQHAPAPRRSVRRRPARDRVQNRVQLLVGALLDQDLPALVPRAGRGRCGRTAPGR